MAAGATGSGMAGLIRKAYREQPLVQALLAGPALVRRKLIHRQTKPMRDMVLRMGERIKSDVVLDVPEFEGRFRCSPRSHLFTRIALHGEYEPDLARIFLEHLDPDGDVIDVGANIGFFSVLAARKLARGKVLACEPTSGAHARLVENLASNGVQDKVVVFKGAAANAEGTMTLSEIEGMEEYSSLGGIHHAAARDEKMRTSEVPVRTLDSLVAEHGLKPKLIKIDVEGAEGLVFGGAWQTLREYRPVILAEFSPLLLAKLGTDATTLLSELTALGYRITDPLEPGVRPGARQYGDILCLPA